MNDVTLQRLARYLSVTESRSGEAIANELGCSRTAVWKHVETLRQLGIEIEAIAGQGYRLTEPLELLDRASILAQMDKATLPKLASLDIEMSVDSTNAALQRRPSAEQHAACILAEHQIFGRGRRGRQWHSPFGRNLYLSLGWRFEQSLSELGCLPLVVALSAVHALQRAGLEGHRVKWPNDLLLEGCKLGGCLVEVQGDAQGPCHAVLGIGVNVHMPATSAATEIDQEWTDLYSHLPNCSRNELAVLILEKLINQLELFSRQGFAPFKTYWEQMDALRGQEISVYSASGSLQGTAKGIDNLGALILDTGTEILKLHSGEVSLKKTGI